VKIGQRMMWLRQKYWVTSHHPAETSATSAEDVVGVHTT